MEMKGKPTRWSGKRHSMARIGRVRRSPKHIDNDTKESSPDGTLFPSLPCYMPLCVAEAPLSLSTPGRNVLRTEVRQYSVGYAYMETSSLTPTVHGP